MLIINGDQRSMSGAEKAVLAHLRTAKAPGIAISGCYVPSRAFPSGGRQAGQEVDVVLLTPAGPTCLEVKGIVKFGASGTLSCPVNGRWRLSGIEGDPVHVRATDTNPLEQLAGAMFGLKDLAETATGGEVFVVGRVVVVPNKGTIVLDRGTIPMPTGRDVLLDSELGRWLAAGARRPATWTAAQVFAVLNALGLAEDITYDAVLGAGFADDQQPPRGTATGPLPAGPEPAESHPGAGVSRPAGAPLPSTPAGVRRARVHPWMLVAGVACLLVALAWVFLPGYAAHNGGSGASTTLTAPPAPALSPPGQGAPLPTTPAAVCYPFQPGC